MNSFSRVIFTLFACVSICAYAQPIQGIVIVSQEALPKVLSKSDIFGVELKGITVPGRKDKFKKQLEPFLGAEISQETLIAIKKSILSYYRVHHRQMLLVDIPEQDVTEGVVLLVLTEGKVGEMSCYGNNWFSCERVKAAVDVKSGDTINEEKLLNNIAWMNRNPFHRTDVVLAPGKKDQTTNLELNTKDRFPLRPYVGADNTGNGFSGNTRLFAGMTWGQPFGRDDVLTYQYTTSVNLRDFRSHFGNYTIFLPWKHSVDFYGGYSWIQPKITDFNSVARNAQISSRYTIPIKPLYTDFSQDITFGFDYKKMNSDLFFISVFEELPIISQEVNLTQLTLAYALNDVISSHQVNFDFECFYSPGKWLPHQSNADFESLRAHAKNHYFYARAAAGDNFITFKDFSIAFLFRGQVASGTLIPSEAFGLGGYNTVRGYKEREVLADNGVCANLELRAPPFKLFKGVKNEVVFLAFADYGWAYNYHPLPDTHKTDQLLSVGPGIRYTIFPYLAARADYGFKLHKTQFGHHSLGKFNAGITVSY